MRYLLTGLAFATVAGAALAQDSVWQFYEPDGGTLQAFVLAEDGSQLILKCDKPGKQKVFAVVVANTNLAAPMSDDKYESYPVSLRFDEGAPQDDNWRFNGRFAMAVDQGNTRSLTRLLEKLDDATKLEVRLKPIMRSPTVINFAVAGAGEAIARVYESCKDESPVG